MLELLIAATITALATGSTRSPLVEEITALLPVSFGFAAGAILALVAIELMPRALGESRRRACAGTAIGAGVMALLGQALKV